MKQWDFRSVLHQHAHGNSLKMKKNDQSISETTFVLEIENRFRRNRVNIHIWLQHTIKISVIFIYTAISAGSMPTLPLLTWANKPTFARQDSIAHWAQQNPRSVPLAHSAPTPVCKGRASVSIAQEVRTKKKNV